MWLNDLFWGIRAHFWGEIITFWWWMITLEGPQCIVDKSSKKILARGRTPTHPFLAMPGFSDHLYPHPLPYWSFFAQCNGWFSMFSNCYPKVKLNNALKGGKLLLEAATSSSQRKNSPGGRQKRNVNSWLVGLLRLSQWSKTMHFMRKPESRK